MTENKTHIAAALIAGLAIGAVAGALIGPQLQNQKQIEGTSNTTDTLNWSMNALDFDYHPDVAADEKINFAAKPETTDTKPHGLDYQLDNPNGIKLEHPDGFNVDQWFNARAGGAEGTIGLKTTTDKPDSLAMALCTKIERHNHSRYFCIGQGTTDMIRNNWWLGGNSESGWEKIDGNKVCHEKLGICFAKTDTYNTFKVLGYPS